MADEARTIDEGWETTGERLRVLRRRKELSLRELANRIGVAHSTLATYERDEISPPGEIVRKLALELGTSADFILRLKATPPKVRGKRTKSPLTEPRQDPIIVAVK